MELSMVSSLSDNGKIFSIITHPQQQQKLQYTENIIGMHS